MPLIHTPQLSLETLPDETVLDALIRRGVSIPFSCRGGSCRSCLQRCVDGAMPERAQRNLAPELVAAGYFMPCICVPTGEMRIAPPDPRDFWIGAVLAVKSAADAHASSAAAPGAWTFQFEPLTSFACAVGTPIALRNADGLTGRAAATSDPAADFYLDLVLDDGNDFGRWAIAALNEGDTIDVQIAVDPAPRDAVAADTSTAPAHPEPAPPPPDPALWAALGNGRLVTEVLEDFYTRVYADTQLAPFFRNFTKQRLVEKQYSFLNQLITGDKVYFGNRPRTTHHWMVISDELFDHREALMQTVLREHGLSEDLVARWHAIENHYRGEMVKSAPWPKKIGEFEAPLDGFGELVLEVGSICDGCGRGVDVGETVRYHLREGTVFCDACGGEAVELKAA